MANRETIKCRQPSAIGQKTWVGSTVVVTIPAYCPRCWSTNYEGKKTNTEGLRLVICRDCGNYYRIEEKQYLSPELAEIPAVPYAIIQLAKRAIETGAITPTKAEQDAITEVTKRERHLDLLAGVHRDHWGDYPEPDEECDED